VEIVTDLFVPIRDLDAPDCPSVTNDADRVVSELQDSVADLTHRRVFYQDLARVVDELLHKRGLFKGFAACSKGQREMLMEYLL